MSDVISILKMILHDKLLAMDMSFFNNISEAIFFLNIILIYLHE